MPPMAAAVGLGGVAVVDVGLREVGAGLGTDVEVEDEGAAGDGRVTVTRVVAVTGGCEAAGVRVLSWALGFIDVETLVVVAAREMDADASPKIRTLDDEKRILMWYNSSRYPKVVGLKSI